MVIATLMQSNNLGGFLFLLFGTGIAGLFFIPIAGYFYRHLKIICRRMSLIGTIFCFFLLVPNTWGWVGLQWITEGVPVIASIAMWMWLVYVMNWIYVILMTFMIPDHVEPL